VAHISRSISLISSVSR